MAHMRENRYAYRILRGKPKGKTNENVVQSKHNSIFNKGKRPCGRSRCRWEDETTMDFKEIG